MRSLIVAPHPDDELLGCGGTLLKRVSEGKTVGWILMTKISADKGWSRNQIDKRDIEIERVREGLGISADKLYRLDFPAAELDELPISTLISSLSDVFNDFQPQEVFLPHPGDIHSDHQITFKAASACTKWFRYPSVRRILTYETLSETNFGFDDVGPTFSPNLYVDISQFLQTKLELLSIYNSEMSSHPFPRSFDAVKSQAILRGSQMGVRAAEAFRILKQFE